VFSLAFSSYSFSSWAYHVLGCLWQRICRLYQGWFSTLCSRFLTAHREERASAGARAGFVTGFTGATIVMLALILTIAIIALQASENKFSISLDFTIAFILLMVLLLNVLGVLLATVGGAFGRSMGRGWS
jgi:Family of unknown function (DUF5518)